jgi:hypothetical protein
MKGALKSYADDLNLSRTVRARVDELRAYAERLTSQTVVDMFVTDYLNDDGVRQYENLWFFTTNGVVEAKQFLQKDDIDYLSSSRRPNYYWRIESEHYNFEKASDASRLSVTVRVDQGFGMQFKASGSNCDHLSRLLRAHVFEETAQPNRQPK